MKRIITPSIILITGGLFAIANNGIHNESIAAILAGVILLVIYFLFSGFGWCDSCSKLRRISPQVNMNIRRNMCAKCREAANEVERMLGDPPRPIQYTDSIPLFPRSRLRTPPPPNTPAAVGLNEIARRKLLNRK